MADDPQSTSPILNLNVPLTVVLVSLVVGFAVFGFWVMYDSKVVHASPEEFAWIASQQKNSAAAISALDDLTTISLVRRGCSEGCPAYEITLYGSGRATFRGRAFTCERSPPETYVDPLIVAKLIDGLRVGGFERMPDYVQEDWLDAQSSRLVLTRGENQHSVEHYHGDNDAPRLLRMMEDRVVEIAQAARWLPIGAGSQAVCQLADGSTKPVEELTIDDS